MSRSEEHVLFEQALSGLKYLDVVDSQSNLYEAKALCRIDRRFNKQWATALESLLRSAEDWGDNEWSVELEVYKQYFLKNGKMVYGWVIHLTSTNLDLAVSKLGGALVPFSSRAVDSTSLRTDLKKSRSAEHPPPKRAKGVPLRYLAEKDVRRPVRKLESDAKGNPIVPEEHRVWEQPMAGMPGDYDRNSPNKGKGAFGMLTQPFAPPGRGGKVGAAPNE